MNDYDYGKPMRSNVSNSSVDNNVTYSMTYNVTVDKQLQMMHGAFGLSIVLFVMSLCLFVPSRLVVSYPTTAGILVLLLIVIEEVAIVAVIVLFCLADNIEYQLTQPPHFGFILNNKMLSLVTTRRQTHGFAIACCLVVFVTAKLVLYLWSWFTYLCNADESSSDTDSGSDTDSAAVSTQLATKSGANYGSAGLDDRQDQLLATAPTDERLELTDSKDHLAVEH
jgi:hypothetical protein